MLPAGFQWVPRYQNAPPGELALHVDGLEVASLMQKVDGSWLALLRPHQEPMAPFRTRDCTSRGAGITGIQAWALRHEAHLRAEALVYLSRPRRHMAAPPLPSRSDSERR